MRFGLVFVSVSVVMLAAASAWADPEAEAVAENPAPAADPAPASQPPPGYALPTDERTANNSIYAEGLGPGLLYSINYDRTFGDFAGRVGFSYLSLSATTVNNNGNFEEAHGSFITVPLTLTYIGIGSKKHIFEIGAGATIVNVAGGVSTVGVSESKTQSGSTTLVFGNLIFGYRMQPPHGGFLLRAGLSPIFGSGVFLPWPYLGLGGTF